MTTSMTISAAVFGSLAGRWAIDRAIEPAVGTFTGTAQFSPLRTDELFYREDGRLRLAVGQELTAYREYVYVLAGESIEVRFAVDGQAGGVMHRLGFDSGRESTDVHPCREDRYIGTYRFDGEDRFTISMRVVGPDKDYQLLTTYRRLVSPVTDQPNKPSRASGSTSSRSS